MPNNHTFSLTSIGLIHSPFTEKFGTPRQSGLVKNAKGTIEIFKEYSHQELTRGLEGFSHIWLLYIFHRNPAGKWNHVVRPPRLGGNVKVGLFATRSPYRPNPIGLSSVEITNMYYKNGQNFIEVQGLDIIDQTPLLDVRPYLKSSDSHVEALNGWTEGLEETRDRKVLWSLNAQEFIYNHDLKKDFTLLVEQYLSLDPRPAYEITNKSSDVQYGNRLSGFDIQWTIQDEVITVDKIVKL